MDYSKLIVENAKRWLNMKTTRDLFHKVAVRLVNAKKKYKSVEASTKVPWFIIAVIHERESNQDWRTSLAQGDRWDRVSTHVPKGRGPFSSWEEAAEDALINCPPYAAKWTDWSAGGALTLLEKYNGLGYYNRGKPSPYIWAGTDQYVSGKYVADGVYDPNHVDNQLGCAGLIKYMMGLDDTVSFTGALKSNETTPTTPKTQPEIKTEKKSLLAVIFDLILGFLKGK